MNTREFAMESALRALRAWLTNGRRGAYGEPVPLASMLEVIDAALELGPTAGEGEV